jgi:MFS transporter, UMF1 family
VWFIACQRGGRPIGYAGMSEASEGRTSALNIEPADPVKKREIFGWCCFDFANSAFTTIVITVVGMPYFTAVVAAGHEQAGGWWGTTLALSQVCVLLLAPLIGVVADVHARKKRYLLITVVLCSVATGLLFGVQPGQVWLMLGLILVANFAFSTSENICSAFLPEISTPENVGRISGYGWSFGYLGGLLSLIIVLVILKSGEGRAHWAFLTTGLFFFLASLPTLLLLKERAKPRPLAPSQTYRRLAWKQFGDMRRELPQHRTLLIFFGAMTCYLAGLMAVVGFAAGYASEVIGMSQEEITGLFAVLQIAGVVGAYGFGFLQDRLGPKTPLIIALVLWIVVCAWASKCDSVSAFYLIGVLAGMAMGGLQSASRAVVATLTPVGRSGEFFGYWGFFAKLAAMIGTFSFGWMVTEYGYRAAIMYNGGFFVVGLIGLILLALTPRATVTET